MVPSPRRTLPSGRRRLHVAADRAILGLLNGLSLALEGAAPHQDSVPKERILAEGKLEVHRYRLSPDELALGTEVIPARHLRPVPVPVVLVPPLMVRPYVYDLQPEHSLVRFLVEEGFDVYIVDFGVPDHRDRRVNLDTYTLEYVPRALEAVRHASGCDAVSMVGYCMGGIFGLMYGAATGDAGLRNLVTIGAPIDFGQLGAFTWLAQVSHPQVTSLVQRLGNIPGIFPQLGMKMTTPLRNLTRYLDLLVNLYDDDYVRRFGSVHRWVNDFIPYPRDAFQQFFTEIMYGNKLKEGRLTLRDREVDLLDFRGALLAFAATNDTVATLASTRAILDAVGSEDKTFIEVEGGHIGVVAGSRARTQVWAPMADWLRSRSRVDPVTSTP